MLRKFWELVYEYNAKVCILYDAGEKMPRPQIWTGVKKFWMKNIEKLLEKNDEK